MHIYIYIYIHTHTYLLRSHFGSSPVSARASQPQASSPVHGIKPEEMSSIVGQQEQQAQEEAFRVVLNEQLAATAPKRGALYRLVKATLDPADVALIHKVLPEPRGTMCVELSSPGPLSAQRMQRVVGALETLGAVTVVAGEDDKKKRKRDASLRARRERQAGQARSRPRPASSW